MHPSTLHILLDAAPIVRSRNVALPRFVRLPGCNNSVIYVEPENSRQVCHFCFAMGHNIHQCHIKKGVHVRDYEMNVEKGITRVNRKTYICLKLVWWIPPKVNEIIAMKEIQQSLEKCHKANREREEELTNSEETGDFMDPSTPDEVRMDDGTIIADCVIHPDLRE
ncbi:hypothetical protein DSO57_1017780 [Entomophthora muscae]|uniref:Uncharacterized protein n=1 Tax=Entomophthora muscae TaxID=34485 RepID=A0ACC2S6J2_9FUNG|nr:hypothetical protein DSO57_1017780 [Entomophthora muscae]